MKEAYIAMGQFAPPPRIAEFEFHLDLRYLRSLLIYFEFTLFVIKFHVLTSYIL